MYKWSLDAALSVAISPGHVFVSTDSPEIAAATRRSGATVLLRPKALATDTARVADCLLHDLDAITGHGSAAGLIVVLLPTSPFRQPADVRSAIELLRRSPHAQSLVSVSRTPAPIAQSIRVDARTGLASSVAGNAALTSRSRRQDHEAAYYPDGALYVVRADAFRRDPRFFIDGATIALVSSRFSAIDLDTPDDWMLAEIVAKELLQQAEAAQ